MMPKFLTEALKIAADNSPLILTSVGVAGVVGTAVLTGKATLHADRLIQVEVENRIYEAHDLGTTPEPFTTKDKVNLVWREYIPPVLVGGFTIAAVIMSHRIGGKRTAAMAAAFTMSERSFGEYKDKVVDIMGQKKATEIDDAVAQDQVTRTPVPSTLVVPSGTAQLCFDSWSSRYFWSTMEDLKKAMNDLNYKLINSYDNVASLTDFYNLLGLEPTQGSDDIGWNVDRLLELEFTSCISPEQKPAIAIRYRVEPTRNYFRR